MFVRVVQEQLWRRFPDGAIEKACPIRRGCRSSDRTSPASSGSRASRSAIRRSRSRASRSSRVWKSVVDFAPARGVHARYASFPRARAPAMRVPPSSVASRSQGRCPWPRPSPRSSGRRRSATRRAAPARRRARSSRSSALSSATRSIDRDLSGDEAFVEGDARLGAAALERAARPRPLDQNLAHRVRSDGAEVRAVLPPPGPVLHQPQVGLVDQGRRLQRLSGTLAAQIARPQAAAAPRTRSAAAHRARDPAADRPASTRPARS